MHQTRANLDKKRAEVSAMFDGVAARYDLLNSLLSLGRDRGWRRETVTAVAARPGERILDLAAGTGTSSLPFVEAGAHVFPTDLSMGMLKTGKQQHPRLPFVRGDALALPYADSVFDAVTISYGLRNVEDTAAALRELLRVTRPGGRMVIAEFSTPVNRALRFIYVAYGYLAESILAWPAQEELADLIANCGWQNVEWKNLTGGIVALHRAWK